VNNRRVQGDLTEKERDIRAEILAGLIADGGGEAQISTATRILAEIISSDVALLITFNQAIENVIKKNEKARQNPKALAQLDGYKRPLVGSLSANLQRFGMERVAKAESLQEPPFMVERVQERGPIRRKISWLFSGLLQLVEVKAVQRWPGTGLNRRHEDFQSRYGTGTIRHHWS